MEMAAAKAMVLVVADGFRLVRTIPVRLGGKTAKMASLEATVQVVVHMEDLVEVVVAYLVLMIRGGVEVATPEEAGVETMPAAAVAVPTTPARIKTTRRA